MKRKWITAGLLLTFAVAGAVTVRAFSLADKIDYDVHSYSIRLLSEAQMTLRVVYSIKNPSNTDLDIWNQSYDVFVAGHKMSTVTSSERYKLAANTTSQIPIDINLIWKELADKIPAFGSISNTNSMADLPVVIKGKLSAKMGIIRLSRIPVRAVTTLGYLLP